MKKYIATLSLAGLATMAQAATEIYISGATAFRTEVYNTLFTNVFGLNSGGVTNVNWVGGPNDNAFSFKGQDANANDVVIYCSWSGSAAGVGSALQLLPVATPYINIDSKHSTNNHQYADLAFSDVQQDSTPYSSTNGYSSTMQVDPVGIVPFVFVKNSNTLASAFRNMTPDIAKALFANGKIQACFFTASINDLNTSVYLTGRNPDSGTRITTLADTGVGINAVIKQYMSTNNGVSNNWVIFPPNSTYPNGDGYSSGSGITSGLNTNVSVPVISYLGIADAGKVGTANWLSYNGTDYYKTNVINGKYAFWTKENLFRSDSVTTAGGGDVTYDFADQLLGAVDSYLSTIYTSAQPLAIPLSQMKVNRNSDGGVITKK